MTAVLGWAAVFLGSAVAVIRSGVALSRAGDLLADQTGLGRLWVGTVFLAVATSLPELVTNLSAVRLGAPALAGGNILGANMLNIVVLAALVSLFPAVVVRPMGRDQGWLVATALALTGVATGLVAIGGWGGVGPVSLGTVLILGGYVAGMTAVYRARAPELEGGAAEIRKNPGEKRPLGERAWVRFALAAGGVLLAAPLLAASADRLADLLGISGSFMGVLAVAIVTTIPETSVTFGALRLGSGEMALGNVYGSCAFNVAILGIADLLYPQPMFHALDRSHVVAGVGAVLLMVLAGGVLYLRARRRLRASQLVALGIVGIWIGVMFLVFSQARGALPWSG